jgi:hypothetical protein
LFDAQVIKAPDGCIGFAGVDFAVPCDGSCLLFRIQADFQGGFVMVLPLRGEKVSTRVTAWFATSKGVKQYPFFSQGFFCALSLSPMA